MRRCLFSGQLARRSVREAVGIVAVPSVWMGEESVSVAAQIKVSLELPLFVVNAYLDDLTDAELLTRPYEGMNHIALQLGHLIGSEKFHIETAFPDAMPALPDGFYEMHSKEAGASDDPADFLDKATYLALMEEQRAGTLAILARLSDDELAAPSPEQMSYLGPTIGCLFSAQATHWMMHAGQWAVIRRRLGRPPLF